MQFCISLHQLWWHPMLAVCEYTCVRYLLQIHLNNQYYGHDRCQKTIAINAYQDSCWVGTGQKRKRYDFSLNNVFLLLQESKLFLTDFLTKFQPLKTNPYTHTVPFIIWVLAGWTTTPSHPLMFYQPKSGTTQTGLGCSDFQRILLL